MSTWTLLVLAIGLSADAFAISVGKGLQVSDGVATAALILGGAFGLAQAVMPILGWLFGNTFAERVSRFAPWIAFIILVAVGLKMLYEVFTPDDDDVTTPTVGHGLGMTEVIVLAVATSIDALAVGVSMAVLDVSIWWTAATIGIVTFCLSATAVVIGHHAGTRFRRPAEIVGGLILIGIGIRVLIT